MIDARARQLRGWWKVLSVDPPRSLEFEDGFADDAGNPNLDLPTTTARVTLSEAGGQIDDLLAD